MITPIFRIFDIEKAHSFYIDYLGFQVDWKHQYEGNMPLYLQVSLNDIVLHLSEHHGDASPGSAIRIKLENLRKYHAFLMGKEYAYAQPAVEETPWNTREIIVIDPFSNRLTFYEDLEQ
jgi:catechol 2,3-dioxygenase-like lactoylglutathione lyase family enzyme